MNLQTTKKINDVKLLNLTTTTIKNYTFFKSIPTILFILFGISFLAVLLNGNRVFREISFASILIAYLSIRLRYYLFPKNTIVIDKKSIFLSKEKVSFPKTKIEEFKIEINGWKGEKKYGKYDCLLPDGFGNKITFKSGRRKITTEFLLRDPEEEKTLVLFLQKHHDVNIKRFC